MSRPWMPLYVADYLADTAHLRATESGAYLHLIMHYWQHAALPHDDRALATIAKLSDLEWGQYRATLQAFFHDGWRHKRIDQELAEAEQAYQRRAKAGSQRWKKNRSTGVETQSSSGVVSRETEQCSNNAPALHEQPQPHSQKEEGGGEDARATLGQIFISKAAIDIADDITKSCGVDLSKPTFQRWCGAAIRVQAWLDHGWPREIIMIGVREGLGSKRDGPPRSINYFEDIIARCVAEQSRPVPAASHPEPAHAQATHHQPGGAYGARKDAFAEAHRELKERIAQSHNAGDSAGGGQVVELLPATRRR